MKNKTLKIIICILLTTVLFFPGVESIVVNNTAMNTYYDETLYAPWDDWDHVHDMGGLVGWDIGWEDGSNYDIEVYTNMATAVLGVYGGHQDCWNEKSWTAPEDNWYRYTFDFDYEGWVNLAGGGAGVQAGFYIVKVFFKITNSSGSVLYNYMRIVEAISSLPYYPFNTDFEGNEHVTSSSIFLEYGDTVNIEAGVKVYSTVYGWLASFQTCVGKTLGDLNYIEIDTDIQSSPLLHISPNPPDHDFGDIYKSGEYYYDINIWNGGIDTLTWSIGDDCDWIEISNSSGTSNGEIDTVRVTVDASELSYGAREGHVSITSNAGDKIGLILINVVNAPPCMPYNPVPENESVGQSIDTELQWGGGDLENDPVLYDVYFGTDSNPDDELLTHTVFTSCDPGTLSYNTTYYWKIIAKTVEGDFTEGPVWHFTTKGNTAPDVPYNQRPTDGEINQPIPVDLKATVLDYDSDLMDVSFYSKSGELIGKDLDVESGTWAKLTWSNIEYNTWYSWYVIADDGEFQTRGPSSGYWDFKTMTDPSDSQSPSDPIVLGPNEIDIGDRVDFTVSSEDPEGLKVRYGIDWKYYDKQDFNVDEWTDWHVSGEEVSLSYKFDTGGTYDLGFIAEDEDGEQSEWVLHPFDVSGGTVNLEITSIWAEPDPFLPGEKVEAKALCKNIGNRDAYNLGILWQFDGHRWGAGMTYMSLLVAGATFIEDKNRTWPNDYELHDITCLFGGVSKTIYKSAVENVPPNKPSTPEGSSSGKPEVEYVYSVSTIDRDGDDVYYLFDWGDGANSGWLGPYNSGATCKKAHVWGTRGSYDVKVKAKDTDGEESDWSESLSVSMPRSHIVQTRFIEFLGKVIEHFPFLKLSSQYHLFNRLCIANI